MPIPAAEVLTRQAVSFNPAIDVSDIIAIVALTVTVTAALLAFRQFRANATANRARFLFDMVRWYQDDAELRHFFYRLDYGLWEFDPQGLPMSEDEHHIDRLLMSYDLVEHFLRIGVLHQDELPVLQFEASQVMNNPEVRRYLDWLDSEFESVNVPTPAFARARALARRF